MSAKREPGERFSLSRWSRRKLESVPAAPVAAAAAPAPASAAPAVPATPAPPELPPVESLNFDSDFTAFLRADVDDKIKRAALKQLFRDPRFNVMDGLDTYIDDYTKADPIPPDMLAGLLQRFRSALDAGAPPGAAAPGAGGAADATGEEALPNAVTGERLAAAPAQPVFSTLREGEDARADESPAEASPTQPAAAEVADTGGALPHADEGAAPSGARRDSR